MRDVYNLFVNSLPVCVIMVSLTYIPILVCYNFLQEKVLHSIKDKVLRKVLVNTGTIILSSLVLLFELTVISVLIS